MRKLSYNFFGLKTLHIYCTSEHVLEEADNFLGNFRCDDPELLPQDEERVLLEEKKRSGQYQVEWEGQRLEASGSNALMSRINYFVNSNILAELPYLFVHASVVCNGPDLLVFAGDCNYGKTTLAFALAARGFQYFSDEYAVFDLKNRKILPYPRAGFLSAESLRLLSEVHEKFASLKPLFRRGEAVVNPVKLFPQCGRGDLAYKRAWFFILRPKFGPRAKISPAPQPAALKAVMVNGKNTSQAYQKLGEGFLSGLFETIQNFRCFYLRPGHPGQSAKAVRALLENRVQYERDLPLSLLLHQVRGQLTPAPAALYY